MARNIYKSAMAVGTSSGKLRASMYDLASFESQKKMEDIELSLESERLSKNIGAISDTLSLASVAAGRYGDISEDISTLESEYGEMEQPEGMFKKLLQSAKIGFGVGEYQFGEKTIAARDFATTAAGITQQSMFQEAMSNLTKSDDVLSRQRQQLAKAQALQSGNESFNMDMDYEDDIDDFEPKTDPIDSNEEVGYIDEYLKQRYRF